MVQKSDFLTPPILSIGVGGGGGDTPDAGLYLFMFITILHRETSFGRVARRETPGSQKLRRLLDQQREDENAARRLTASTLTPSVIRKQMLFHRHLHEKINLCYLAAGQVIGTKL